MSWFSTYIKSSIGKKQLMAVSGLAWAGFALAHLIGNTPLLFGQAEAFNKYANFLTGLGGLLYAAEAVLTILLLMHLVLAFKTRKENKKARPFPYDNPGAKVGNRSLASFTMPYTGIVIFIFLIVHILTFKYGAYHEVTYDGETMRNLYKTVADSFANPIYSLFYVFCMAAFGLHVGHGVGSGLQTFGLNHPRYNGTIAKVSTGYAYFVGGGNILITVVMFIKGNI